MLLPYNQGQEPIRKEIKTVIATRTHSSFRGVAVAAVAALSLAGIATASAAQDRLQTMPGYDNYTKMAPVYQQNTMVSGSIGGGGGGRGGGGGGGGGGVVWAADGKSMQYSFGGNSYNVTFANKRITQIPATAAPDAGANPGRAGRAGGGGGGAPPGGRAGAGGGGGNTRCGVSLAVQRGRQSPLAASPDGRLVAIHKNRNLVIANADCSGEYAVTTDGNEATSIKYGTGSWVYGEELGQNTAMCWNRGRTNVG
jgi:dipeptidyl-peptidase-4